MHVLLVPFGPLMEALWSYQIGIYHRCPHRASSTFYDNATDMTMTLAKPGLLELMMHALFG